MTESEMFAERCITSGILLGLNGCADFRLEKKERVKNEKMH